MYSLNMWQISFSVDASAATTSTTTITISTATTTTNTTTGRPVTVSGHILLYTWFHLRMRNLLNARTLEKIQHTKILNRQI